MKEKPEKEFQVTAHSDGDSLKFKSLQSEDHGQHFRLSTDLTKHKLKLPQIQGGKLVILLLFITHINPSEECNRVKNQKCITATPSAQ